MTGQSSSALSCCLPRWMRRRKHQFLVVAAVYVFCSMGLMHQDFPFQMFYHVSRSMLAEEATYSPRRRSHLDDKPSASSGIVGSILKKIGATVGKRQRIKWERAQMIQPAAAAKWEENPIFVLNLPGSGTQTAFRYFKCGFGDSKDIALYWAKIDEATALQGTTKRNSRHEIGKCFQNNLQRGSPPLEGCGMAKVWASMGYSSIWRGQCFYPTMDPTAMESLAKTYPKATIMQVIQDPEEWYESSYPRFRTNLATSCQDVTTSPIPAENATRDDWIAFYEWHEDSVRDFAQAHPTLQYVEVDLKDANASFTLKHQLGLPRMCWQPPKRLVNRLERIQEKRREKVVGTARTPRQQRQVDELVAPPQTNLPYPIFVASLPKSGTTSTQRFFQCGLGYNKAGHQWTENKTTEEPLKIGKCMQYNMQHNRSLFEDCGDFNIWTDTGYMEERSKYNKGQTLPCFFPTMHGGLEAFYQSHPNGTIMNVIRDPDQWYESAMSWRKLPERMSKQCAGFPPRLSSSAVWRQFYRWHTQQVRAFARQHPSLTYLEVSLEANDTGKILQEHTGIPSFCWGDCNPDARKAQCGVLKKMRDFKLRQIAEQRQARDWVVHWHTTDKYRNGRKTKKHQLPLPNDPKWRAIEQKFNMLQLMPVQTANGKIEALPSSSR